MISSRRFNESVAILRLRDSSITVSPLGIYQHGDKLYANIYPGTRLHEKALEAIEACILFPFSVKPFYYSMGIGCPLKTTSPRAISTPCAAYDGVVIEAVIASRERIGEKLRLEIKPITLYVRGEPRPYSRDYGCSIELLIALSRLRFWANTVKPIDCRMLVRLFEVAELSFNCILHATWDEELHSLGAKALQYAREALALSNCA